MSDRDLNASDLENVSGAGAKPTQASSHDSGSTKGTYPGELDKQAVKGISGAGPKPGMTQDQSSTDKKSNYPDELDKHAVKGISGGAGDDGGPLVFPSGDKSVTGRKKFTADPTAGSNQGGLQEH